MSSTSSPIRAGRELVHLMRTNTKVACGRGHRSSLRRLESLQASFNECARLARSEAEQSKTSIVFDRTDY